MVTSEIAKPRVLEAGNPGQLQGLRTLNPEIPREKNHKKIPSPGADPINSFKKKITQQKKGRKSARKKTFFRVLAGAFFSSFELFLRSLGSAPGFHKSLPPFAPLSPRPPPPMSRGIKRDKLKGTNGAKFAGFSLIFAFPGNYSIWEAQIFAENRRKPQIFAENRRKLQIFAETGLSHLVCPF